MNVYVKASMGIALALACTAAFAQSDPYGLQAQAEAQQRAMEAQREAQRAQPPIGGYMQQPEPQQNPVQPYQYQYAQPYPMVREPDMTPPPMQQAQPQQPPVRCVVVDGQVICN